MSELFLPIRTCPSRRARACGSNLQHGWSMTTSFTVIAFRSGWIGSLALKLLPFWSQTKTFLTPPFLPTTNSSLTTLHLAHIGSLLVSTFATAGGDAPPQVTCPLTVPQSAARALPPQITARVAASAAPRKNERITCLQWWPRGRTG